MCVFVWYYVVCASAHLWENISVSFLVFSSFSSPSPFFLLVLLPSSSNYSFFSSSLYVHPILLISVFLCLPLCPAHIINLQVFLCLPLCPPHIINLCMFLDLPLCPSHIINLCVFPDLPLCPLHVMNLCVFLCLPYAGCDLEKELSI